MKNLILTLASMALFAFAVPCVTAQDTPKDGLFIHISHGSDNPHRLLMALSMAAKMAGDHDVLVYFDIQAIDAVLKDSPDISFSHFASSKALLKTLREKGVLLMACPACLKAAGKSQEDLADGIQPADKQQFFAFTKGRILSLDY